MDLVQIRYFITAAQFQNLSKAAHVLNITQPALSKSILKLEDELDVRLFDRSGKKIRLNESGERFLQYAISTIQELDDAVAAVKNKTISPMLKVGLFHHSEEFMRCLGDFMKANPNISFQLERLDIAAQSIDTNVFDMLLYPQNPLFRKYRGVKIYSDPYFIAVHKSNPLAHLESVVLDDVSAQRLILIRHGDQSFDLPYHLCTGVGINAGEGLFTNSYEIQRWLVSNNRGVGFVPQGSAGAYAVDPGVALVPVADERLSQDIMVGFKREKHLSTAGKHLAGFVRGYFQV